MCSVLLGKDFSIRPQVIDSVLGQYKSEKVQEPKGGREKIHARKKQSFLFTI